MTITMGVTVPGRAKPRSAVQSDGNAPWRALGPWSDAIPFGRLATDAVPIPPRADRGAAEPRTPEMPKPTGEGGP